MTIHQTSTAGLDGVAAAVTALSHVDGEAGELVITGHRVGELASETGFEGVVARLWSAAGGKDVAEADVRAALGQARLAAFRRLPDILPATRGMPIVDAFRAAVAAIGPQQGLTPEATLVGALPVLAAALVRQAAGDAPVAPDVTLGTSADLLKMLRGEPASEAEAKALDAYLVTVSDHGMNASTFAARVVASTQANPFMAVTAAYCALSGPLHGGAPGPVLDMLDAIGASGNIAPWVDAALARGDRLMGFGHRIYKVRDPRADVLKAAVDTLGVSKADLGLAAEVEDYARQALARAKPGRRLDTNVEFYTAILLDALKIPRDAFTPVFAAARAAGWTAHAIEQQRTGRLLRPNSVYVGPMPA
ncbi:citrate synthase/methylcitrate synthase [Mesorhizobium sp. LHD-90]|uniref:citrate synthase/methylcitrate synthase n=1 Tax=Mesorhizobium sp. LHD-90 TaxID=3071414 RepID=UPI0027DF6C07|nr:citrate synthase/methylcitrate synthase [Mesorhizobium sp. LHD-90]MDQ6436447.1 citrate synthase/methylcitrate synthase [Mesorhizobium sp. LHD-90]